MIDKNYLIKNGVDLDSALELLGDLSFYNETLQRFLEENEKRVPLIEKYREECNMADYAILVHSLKSDSKYLGFNDLANIAYYHEIFSKENNIDKVNEKSKELFEAIDNATKLATMYLNSGKRTKKIIVADESTVISNIVTKALGDNFEVLAASNGGEAIKFVQNDIYGDVKAILLDLNMPEIDGFAVLDYFKDNNLFEKILVFVITGEIDDEQLSKAKSYPIKNLIEKPFTLESIKSELQTILNE